MFMSSLRIVVDGCSGCLKLSGWFSMCFVYFIPSSWGMFVYREVTSIEASVQSFGRAVLSSRLMKSVVSLMNDGSVCTYGHSQVSMNLDMFSVMLLQLDTIGLMLIGLLCICVFVHKPPIRRIFSKLRYLRHHLHRFSLVLQLSLVSPSDLALPSYSRYAAAMSAKIILRKKTRLRYR